MTRLFRGIFIVWVVLRYGLDELVLTSFQRPWLRVLARIVSVGRNLKAPRGQRIREALERLGPIFVKFGQVLSTRRDLLPVDIADELARLQDQVPPFPTEVAIATIERSLPTLGFGGISGVRVGKCIRFTMDAADEAAARAEAEDLCARFLTNPVIEDATITLHEAAAV